MRRLTPTQQRIIEQLRNGGHMSYEDIAAAADCDRSTVVMGIRRLERHRFLVKERGRGSIPNRYVLTERLLEL